MLKTKESTTKNSNNNHLKRLKPQNTSTLILLISLLYIITCSIFASAALTEEDVLAYRSWSTWGIEERLNFLLYDDDWYNLREEFEFLDGDGDGFIVLEGRFIIIDSFI